MGVVMGEGVALWVWLGNVNPLLILLDPPLVGIQMKDHNNYYYVGMAPW
jgi:hypothetical protein